MDGLTRPADSVRTAGVVVDSGGRPVTDAGGRLVFTDASGALVLDDAGTEPVEPVTATGTDSGPDGPSTEAPSGGLSAVNDPLTSEG